MALTDTTEDLVTRSAEIQHALTGATNPAAVDRLVDELDAIENELYDRAEAAADAAADADAEVFATMASLAFMSPRCTAHTPAR